MMGKNTLLALTCLLDGAKMLTRPELRRFLIMPLLINTVLYSGALILGYHSVSALIAAYIPGSLSWLSWILWPLFFVSFMLIGFFSFSLLANLIAAPYYSQLAVKTRQVLHGQGGEIVDLPWDKVFFGELNRIGYLLMRILPLLLLSLIPVINLVAPVLWGLFAAWGLAMEYLSYPLENHGMPFSGQKQFMREHRWGVLSFGGVIALGLTLPLVNLLIGQTAVIAATLYVHRLSLPTCKHSSEEQS